jgi:hypothetical protein
LRVEVGSDAKSGATDFVTFVVGAWSYSPDTTAAAPNNQLYVACPLHATVVVPEVFAVLQLLQNQAKWTAGHGTSFDLALPRTLDAAYKPYRGATGSMTVEHERVTRLQLRSRSGASGAYALRYDDVTPVSAPPADQITNSECKHTTVIITLPH